MLLLRVFAVLWTVDIIDEKKPDTAFPGDPGDDGFSRVGVNGAWTIFESLLGPRVPEPALRRCDIMFPFVGDAFGCGDVVTEVFLTGLPWKVGWLASVGVGGVFTITGVPLSFDGGVWGGLEVSTLAPCERRRKRSEAAATLVLSLSTTEFTSTPEAFGDKSASGADSWKEWRSGLGLPVADEPFFLKTSRNRPTGDGERSVRDVDAVNPVLLVANVVGSKLSVLVLLTGNVEEDSGEVLRNVGRDCVSTWTAAWTIGEFVVR
jgi:hypothetical protein